METNHTAQERETPENADHLNYSLRTMSPWKLFGPKAISNSARKLETFSRILAAQLRVQPGNGNIPGKLLFKYSSLHFCEPSTYSGQCLRSKRTTRH